jgi:uncharacterized protein
MALRTDTLDLSRLGLSSGQGKRLDLAVHVDPFAFGGQTYAVRPDLVDVRIDVSRTTANGYALRLRGTAELDGPCARCLEPASPGFGVDAIEVHQPGGEDEELVSPYVDGEEELDVGAWTRDALALALPASIVCRPECAGLCAECGANLNEEPGHAHEREPDQRWAKLSEIRFE